MAIIGALPVTLTNGTIGDATQVMADFNYILTQVNTNAAPITGGTYLPLAGGTLSGGLTIAQTAAGANLILNKSASGFVAQISGQTAGSNRWQMQLGNSTAEPGSGNVGSDFAISRMSDAGALIDAPLTITRSSGLATFADTVKVANGNSIQLDGAAGTQRQLTGMTAGVTRWNTAMGPQTESGSNVGTDYSINAYSDAGTFLFAPITIKRSTGVCTFSAAIVNGPSDRSLKENIAPLEDSLDKVLALQGVSFNMIADPEKRRHIGLIAQDVAPIVPEVIQDYRAGDDEPKLALDYPKLVALLIESIKTLTARIEVLEAKLAT
jgi:hypothetical protein